MLELKQTQKLLPVLKLTQQLQQAIKLLQLSQLELVGAIEQEINENPVLEVKEKDTTEDPPEEKEPTEGFSDEKEDGTEWLERYSPSEEFYGKEDKEYPDYENIVRKTYNLRDHLRWQVGLSDFDTNERTIAEWLIGNIDDNGYLAYPIQDISKVSGFPVESLENVLKKIQKLDPLGVGARDLKECILIQYEASEKNDHAFKQIVSSYFELFQKANLKEIAKKTGYPFEKIKEVFEIIKGFDPKPGRNYGDEYTSYVVPDVYVVKKEGTFEVLLNDEEIPELRMNRYYVGLYKRRDINGDTKKYIKNKMRQAEWFIKSIRQRQNTLYLVSKSIVAYQSEFFDKGIQFLKPLILKNVAQDIGVHESTVSRITTNKYVSAPNGIFEMKFFFPTGIHNEGGDSLSTNAVINFITEIINKEDKRNPVTDDDIVAVLKERYNVRIARRTVAKYREALNVRSSRERRVLD
ncbi:MAG: RNA polymerase factor sigma-54 [Proteobacteria bacterium]|nr:RNA polymerase factor sigma-54 [Pseudomonadota bacterium]